MVTLVALVFAGAIAWAGSHHGASFAGIPVVMSCAAWAFALQWLAFIPAYRLRTERFYDLVGSFTYLSTVWFAVVATGSGPRAMMLATLISVWAARLGTFLFRRIHRAGRDARFDELKHRAGAFFTAWTLQGLWVFLTLCASLAAIASPTSPALGALDLVGACLWLAGFTIEVIADRQKSSFRATNPGRFVDVGLWRWSRHPNYFGEIVLWTGIAVIAASTLSGWQWMTMISPVFVYFLLTRVSGIPLLAKRAEDRWGHEPEFREYKARTSRLVPVPPRRHLG